MSVHTSVLGLRFVLVTVLLVVVAVPLRYIVAIYGHPGGVLGHSSSMIWRKVTRNIHWDGWSVLRRAAPWGTSSTSEVTSIQLEFRYLTFLTGALALSDGMSGCE